MTNELPSAAPTASKGKRVPGANRPNPTAERWTACALLAVFLMIALASCSKESPLSEPRGETRVATPDNRPTVVTTNPRQTTKGQRLKLPGTLEPYERAKLYAKVTGYINDLAVDIGDTVAKDDVLARLSVPEMSVEARRAAADVPAMEARIEKAQADAELAKITHERLLKLLEREPGAITQQEVDMAAAKRKVAASQVDVSKSSLEVAKARVSEIHTLLSYGTVKAPFDGVVTGRFADVGMLVTPDAKQPIVEVSRVEKLRLRLDVPEVVVPHVSVGHEATFTIDALAGETFSGTVARTANALRPDTRSMRVEIDVDNEDRQLSAGMYATVELAYGDIRGALVLPATAVKNAEGQSYVYAVGSGDRVQRVAVTLLMDDGAQVVVRSDALSAKSRVVTTAPHGLEAGQACVVRHQTATDVPRPEPEPPAPTEAATDDAESPHRASQGGSRGDDRGTEQ